MDAYTLVVGTSHAVASILAWTLAIFVLLPRPDARGNRLLAGLLTAEGAFQAAMAGLTVFSASDVAPPAGSLLNFVFPTAIVAIFAASSLYLLFLASLDTPLAKPFRRPAFGRGLFVLGSLVAMLALAVSIRSFQGAGGATDALGAAMFILTVLLMTFASIYGFVACVSAWRRARAGTETRKRALAFVLAFGGRDALFLLHILGGPVLGNLVPLPVSFAIIVQAFLGLATAVFAAFLAYGFLRAQLFDLDLRIKLGISRGTVASFALAIVFVISKIVEAYASRNMGFVAGAIAAGLLLFAAPRLNKLGDKVANTAMPAVQPTAAYVIYKKLEVYRAAVESAQETGGITAKDRASLDRLRTKLGLPEADAKALEAELAPTS